MFDKPEISANLSAFVHNAKQSLYSPQLDKMDGFA